MSKLDCVHLSLENWGSPLQTFPDRTAWLGLFEQTQKGEIL